MSLQHLEFLTPGLPWQVYFDQIGLPRPGQIDVNQPQFFAGFGKETSTVPMDDWKVYLTFCLVNAEASRLSMSFDQPNFNFYQKILNGTPQEQPRWKRAVEAIDSEIGDALGGLYVQAYFPPSAKVRAIALVKNLKETLREDIQSLTWMGPTTKVAALLKVDRMGIKVGYPDKWRDYSSLDLSSGSYAVDCINTDILNFQHQLNEIGKPVDRLEWQMTAPTNNAYYDPSNNSINFPAGILQPPFFSASFDDAVNYGEIGATIGHEMTHGFDDQGRQFDWTGSLHNWWTPADLQKFNIRKDGIVAQYSKYEPLPGQHIDGNLTIGENIADIGGLKIAYLAYEKTLIGKKRLVIDGYTPEQAVFHRLCTILAGERTSCCRAFDAQGRSTFAAKVSCRGVIADTPEFKKAFPTSGGSISVATVW